MFQISKEEILNRINHNLDYKMVVDRHDINKYDVYLATVEVMKEIISYPWKETKDKFFSKKKIYYLSFEYLPEQFLIRNIAFFDLEEEFKFAIDSLGFKYEEILESDDSGKLGVGALGRFAFSFVDSASSTNTNLLAYGIRYENGRMKQEIVDFNQVEKVDNWLERGYPWEYKRNIFYDVEFRDFTLKTQGYDIPIVGYKGENISTLRVWDIKTENFIKLNGILKGELDKGYRDYIKAKSIVGFLYPEDSNIVGKTIRLSQEYFYATCSVKDIIRDIKTQGIELSHIEEYATIKLNENHTLMSIPVFIYEYQKETNCSYEFAYEKAEKIFNYTSFENFVNNHKIWNRDLIKDICPNILEALDFIDDHLKSIINSLTLDITDKEYSELAIINNGKVDFTNIALFISNSIAAVSQMHYKIITNNSSNKYSKILQNKYRILRTGTSQRTWLYIANKKLTLNINKIVGSDIIEEPKKLIKLADYKEDKRVHKIINDIKNEKKIELAEEIKRKYNVNINPYSIFDMNLKNFQEYRRQFLTALYITKVYFDLLENSNLDILPRTYFFGGIASQNYLAAKYVINYINNLAYVINSDLRIKDRIKIVFVDNLSIEDAMKFVPAADINEQISTPGLDISGISAVKYMFNGGMTIGSRTGLNLDIRNEIGEENIFLFGKSKEELDDQYKFNYYNPIEYINNKTELKSLIDKLKNYSNKNLRDSFNNIYDIILKYNDSFYVFREFASYSRMQEKVESKYKDSFKWSRIAVTNIAYSGNFSVDYSLEKFKNIVGMRNNYVDKYRN